MINGSHKKNEIPFQTRSENTYLTSKGHLRLKVMAPNESPYMVSYMSIIEMKSLSVVVFEIFAKIAFWPLDLGPRSKVMAPNESPYMVSYMSTIEMKSLSLVVFEIFAKIAFWPSDLGPRSKVMAPNESPYMVSYKRSLYLSCFRDICKNSI